MKTKQTALKFDEINRKRKEANERFAKLNSKKDEKSN